MDKVFYVNGKKLNIIKADSFFSKFRGLMFKKNMFDYGVLFYNTNGIHTFFMFQSIDVILLDSDFNILAVYENVKPWRIILPKKGVRYTLEVPLGYGKYINL